MARRKPSAVLRHLSWLHEVGDGVGTSARCRHGRDEGDPEHVRGVVDERRVPRRLVVQIALDVERKRRLKPLDGRQDAWVTEPRELERNGQRRTQREVGPESLLESALKVQETSLRLRDDRDIQSGQMPMGNLVAQPEPELDVAPQSKEAIARERRVDELAGLQRTVATIDRPRASALIEVAPLVTRLLQYGQREAVPRRDEEKREGLGPEGRHGVVPDANRAERCLSSVVELLLPFLELLTVRCRAESP